MTHYTDPTPTDDDYYYEDETDEYDPSHEDEAYEDDPNYEVDEFVSARVATPTVSRSAVAAPALTSFAGIPDLPPWVPQNYSAFITGSGAEKLASSGVAPLVAAARGYTRIDTRNFKAEMKRMDMSLATKQGKRLKACIAEGSHDGMQMPWYSVADLQSAHRKGEAVKPYTWQIRPEMPAENEQGKPIKYEFKPQTGTPLDLHPGTPIDWIDTTPVVMFAEGMLKGDSAISAYLRSTGVSWLDLEYDGTFDPVAKMRSLLNAIPHDDRVLIVSIAGINNAHQHAADWREIDLKNREGWIAFDADLTVNPFVHAAATKLYEQLDEKSKMKTIRFLNPSVTSGDDGAMAKAGVDDYLAQSGTWSQLLKQLTLKMPPAPARNDNEEPGGFRVAGNGQIVEECIAVFDGPGGQISGYRWEKRVGLGGRVLCMEARRQPTEDEMRTGVFNPNVSVGDIEEARVEVEVAWAEDGQDRTAIITGPQVLLSYPPADWTRHGAVVPPDLLLHPSWPPRHGKGEAWLAAIKGNKKHERLRQTRWTQMGWVPVENDLPVYLIGNQVVGDTEFGSNAVAGIDKEALPVADSYGVGTGRLDGNWDDEDYRAEVAKDFREIMDAYIHSGAWTDRAASVIVLAGGLRPAVPLRPRSTLFFWGPKGGGKSWSAQCCMYFWARRKPDWQDSLPGSAKDTQAYTENAIAHTPIWVIDDLAPSAVRRQAEAEDAKLADMTRAIFNNATKGRMNADMTSRKVNKPIAQLIITAENELSTPSARERLIPVFVGKGRLHPDRDKTDKINTMARLDGTQARFTSHLLRYIRWVAVNHPGGWEQYMTHLEAVRDHLKFSVATIMRDMGGSTGSLERTSTLASDILLTMAVLQEMSIDLKMERPFRDQFDVDELGMSVIKLVTDAHADNQQSAPGASLIRALSALLSSGQAHVISGDDPTRPPVTGNEEGEGLANDMLGWKTGGSDGALRPVGPTIGTVVTVKGKRVILFDQMTAFAKAQAAFPTLIQHGQGTGSGWASVWDEGLASQHVNRARKPNGRYKNTYRAGAGSSRVTGVPVDLERILRGLDLD